MPIYEYACGGCGHEFEALVRSDSAPQCPQCQSTDLNKLLSIFATTNTSNTATAAMPSPCGSCQHSQGPGACALH